MYLFFLIRIIRGLKKLRKQIIPETSLPSISVVIAARNESESIRDTLDCILIQSCQDELKEIIVVNDRSTDATREIIEGYLKKDPRIILINQTEIDEKFSPKKQALEKGISTASGEVIVTTDADCRPGKDWLSTLVGEISNGADMVTGQARFDTGKSPVVWQRLQALDFQSQGIAAAGLVSIGTPFTCAGASFAFKKQLFLNINGYSGVDHLISGDDELLLAKAFRYGAKIGSAKGKNCMVSTRTVKNLSELWQQRIRWGSKGIHYHWSRKVVLIGLFLFFLGLTLSPVYLLEGGSLSILMTFVIGKAVLDYLALTNGSVVFEENFRISDWLLLEIIHAPALVAFTLGGHFLSFKWKGQVYQGKG